MSHTTGTLQLRATSFSEEIGWEGAGALHFLLRNGWIVKGCLWETPTSRLSLWVKVKDCTNKRHLMGGVYYRCLAWGSPLTRTLASATWSIALTNSHPDGGFQPSRYLLGKQYRAGCKQSRRFLECIKGKFQIQVLDKPTREEALVDLLLTNTNEPIQGLRLEAAWAVVVTMPCQSLWSQETWVWQRAKSGPWTSEQWTSSCLKN